jgi:hypothetical protein
MKGSSARVSTIRSAIVVRQRFFGIFWPLFLAARPSDRDRIVTTGPAVSRPPVQKSCVEMMSVSVAGIQKNRCRTTVAEPIGETRAELPFTGDQVGLFRARPGRPKRTCNSRVRLAQPRESSQRSGRVAFR